VPVSIHARERGDNVVRRMRNQGRVVVGIEHSVLRDEVQKMGHLLEIGGDVGVIPREMNIVELDEDHMPDLTACGIEFTSTGTTVARVTRITAGFGNRACLSRNRRPEQPGSDWGN